jgi:hypothetical protein
VKIRAEREAEEGGHELRVFLSWMWKPPRDGVFSGLQNGLVPRWCTPILQMRSEGLLEIVFSGFEETIYNTTLAFNIYYRPCITYLGFDGGGNQWMG